MLLDNGDFFMENYKIFLPIISYNKQADRRIS